MGLQGAEWLMAASGTGDSFTRQWVAFGYAPMQSEAIAWAKGFQVDLVFQEISYKSVRSLVRYFKERANENLARLVSSG